MQMGGLSTAEVARLAGVHRDTLLRWLRNKVIPEPRRDRNGWRSFSEEQARQIAEFARGADFTAGDTGAPFAANLKTLSAIDWDFSGATTGYLTHAIHPYPAKFIPQIPNALIQELSSVGETVGDIFCGSGTTLVEALVLKRHAVGIDANPLACLISRAKTSGISAEQAASLEDTAKRADELGTSLSASGEASLFPAEEFKSSAWRPAADYLSFWFDSLVIEELAECLALSKQFADEGLRDLALTAFSSIVVTVSNQDSDTRYVRRKKAIRPGEVFLRYARALRQITRACLELADVIEPRFQRAIVAADLLNEPSTPTLDLVVCSPPYPNAYSYHLYHQTRMVWLEMDQPGFKKAEIGSHRKYSSKSKHGATPETFRQEFAAILKWLGGKLRKGRYACFVVGDSTIKGERIDNASLIAQAGAQAAFREVARLSRNLQDTKKAFNPAIGKIRSEKILILENVGGGA
jgi:excisionase family DNA binding protein